jgi:mediator of RNA polymerase II transcription subunit 6
VLHYFAQSPFFDHTSNNAILSSQAQFLPALHVVLQTLEAFEARLQTMQGTEFVLASEPTPATTYESGIWVIRKQRRKKRANAPDEVTPLGSYFVIGENIYMAPTVGQVVMSRLLSVNTALKKMQSTASSLSVFSPAYGHSYLPHTSKPAPTSVSSLQGSKESTPMPGSLATSHGDLQKDQTHPQGDTYLNSTRLLLESFNIYARNGDQFTDINPLVGEPGNFQVAHNLSVKTNQGNSAPGLRVQPRQEAQVKAPAKSQSPTLQKRPELGKKTGSKDREGAPKPKRRKSSKITTSKGS